MKQNISIENIQQHLYEVVNGKDKDDKNIDK